MAHFLESAEIDRGAGRIGVRNVESTAHDAPVDLDDVGLEPTPGIEANGYVAVAHGRGQIGQRGQEPFVPLGKGVDLRTGRTNCPDTGVMSGDGCDK